MADSITTAFLPAGLGSWLGGTHYLGNLLRAIADNPQAGVRPRLFVGTGTPAEALRGMPAEGVIRMRSLDSPSAGWLTRAGTRRLFGRDPLLERALRTEGTDVLSHSPQIWRSRRIGMIAWIPDFQHLRLPELFSPKELRARDRVFRQLIYRCTVLILSSESALTDLESFEPTAVAKARILRFVSEARDESSATEPEEAAARHRIAGPYVLMPNQFWVHKNHAVVIEALGLLAARGVEAVVVATGDQHDHRRPEHLATLTARVEQLGVSESFRALGRVDYGDLVALMRGARAVLNPSLCEGWATSVEEARSTGKRTILSDIDTHREQAPADAVYFDPSDPEALATLLEQTLAKPPDVRDAEREAAAARDLPLRRRGYAEAYGAIAREAAAITRGA